MSVPGTFVCGGGGAALTFLLPDDLDERFSWCCLAAAEDGPEHCTCWRPIFDSRQRKPKTDVEAITRTKSCHDCAYRQGSPERERGDDLEGLPSFWCHQGIRRPAAYRHPDGRVRPVPNYVESPDYQPPLLAGVPYRANGMPADRCAGWAAIQAGKTVA